MQAKAKKRWTLLLHESRFLKSEIECGNPARTKRALQEVCRIYRNGGLVSAQELNGFENAIIGALNSGSSDEKVRRWSLSALSQLGRKSVCWSTVQDAIGKFADEPQVVSAAIAATFKLDLDAAQSTLTMSDKISPEILLLSALQTTSPNKLDLTGLKIEIEKAEPTTLKLALVLVGMNRAPLNVFHPRYTNADIVKVLGGHHDGLVTQYSAWAAAESPVLTASDLGIDLTKLDEQPDNVRSYVFRLYGADQTYSDTQHELIEMGMSDESVEARLGLAIGLKDTWYNGLDTLCHDWLYDEQDDEVREHVLDHVVAQASKSSSYFRSAVEMYQDAAKDVRSRQRMEAAAGREEIRKRFLQIAHEEELGLFGKMGSTKVTNNFTINGPVAQASQTGDFNNNATNQTVQTITDPAQALSLLAEAREELKLIDVTPRVEAAQAAIDIASSEPTKSNLETAVASLTAVEKGMSAAAGTAAAALKLGGLVASLAGLI